MLTNEYHGRFGNNLFQYVFARLLADKLGYQLGTAWPHDDILKSTPHKTGQEIVGLDPVVADDLYHLSEEARQIDWMNHQYMGRPVRCRGFFQRTRYYMDRRDEVMQMFEFPEVTRRGNGDWLIHVRLGDYLTPAVRSVIHPFWYRKILGRAKFNPNRNKLYILTDEPNHPWFTSLRNYRPTVLNRDIRTDFLFFREFNNIIISNSSFAWWGAYMSGAQNVWCFYRWMRYSPYVDLGRTPGWTSVQGSYWK